MFDKHTVPGFMKGERKLCLFVIFHMKKRGVKQLQTFQIEFKGKRDEALLKQVISYIENRIKSLHFMLV